MVSFKSLVLFMAAASAAPAIQSTSTYDKCLQDVDNIDSGVKSLIEQLKEYHSGVENTKGPIETLFKIYEALATGVAHSTFLGPMSSDQARNFISHVNSTLTVDNPIAVDLAISKREEFKKAGVDLLVVPALGLLLAGHEAFTVNVGLRTPPLLIPTGLSVTTPISMALLKGIAAFSGFPVGS